MDDLADKGQSYKLGHSTDWFDLWRCRCPLLVFHHVSHNRAKVIVPCPVRIGWVWRHRISCRGAEKRDGADTAGQVAFQGPGVAARPSRRAQLLRHIGVGRSRQSRQAGCKVRFSPRTNRIRAIATMDNDGL